MRNFELGNPAETSKSETTRLQDETWEEHVRLAEKLKRKFTHNKAKNTGEKQKSSAYLLSEHVNPYNTQFGRPQSKSHEDRKFAKEWWKGVCESWDEDGIELPRELGEGIEQIVNDENYFFGIHRSYGIDGSNFENDDVLHSILTNGLQNLGDASSNIVYNDPPVSKTVSPCTNMLITVINLKSSYKGSTGAVLVAIPSDFVDKKTGDVKEGMENEVYNHNRIGNSSIKPEYIMGFIQNLGKGSVLKYESRDEILAAYERNQNQPK